MAVFIIKRLLAIIPIFLFAILLTFIMVKASPVDPAEAYFAATNTHPTPQALEDKRQEMGLNKPIFIQYVDTVKRMVQLNFGNSYMTKRPVVEEMRERLPVTVQLGFLSILLTLIISVPLGFYIALHKNGFVDYTTRCFAFIGASMPAFLVGYLLVVVLSVKLDLLPIEGAGTWQHFVLPTITLALPFIVQYTRMLRANMLEHLDAPSVLFARTRGLTERVIMVKYVLRMAIGPVITGLGINLGTLMTGMVIVEVVFSIPGFGRYFIDAIFSRDMAIIQCYVLLAAALYLVCNLVVDVIQMFIDPRIVKKGVHE